MMLQEVYKQRVEEMEDYVRAGLSAEALARYEEFSKFMNLYEQEKRLRESIYRSCLSETAEN